nr:MAG TPA: hypothetical protein [Bacteriophage sp.]
MALKKFIGARYAPEFAGAWSNTKQYAALSVVYTGNRSYVSRKTVPAGTPITNTEFWIQSSDWNAQVAEYNLKVEGYNANVEKYNKNVQDYSAAVSGFYADTLHSFDTKADMQADRTLALGETLLTCGDKKIGDGGGSFYQVVSETSVTAVALDNGLFAEPFEFQPYDYSQFQQEVEGYKNSTTRVYNTQQDMVADVGINAGNILMTTGALEQGDGQGSFWNVTDNQEEGSVLLQNGKYAKKFNVASVDASGTLLFNNKGNQVAIWGVKAGGETVNVPVSYSLGETRSVFVAVEYDSDNTNATVNLVVSGPVSFTKAFAWSDASVASGQVKTVIYAITLNSKGNSVYTGAQVAASYLTTLEKFVETLTANIPNAVDALSVWNGDSVNDVNIPFTVNRTIYLKDIVAAPGASANAISFTVYLNCANDHTFISKNTIKSTGQVTNFTFPTILTPGNTYVLVFNTFGLFGNAYFRQSKNNVNGFFGSIGINNAYFNGRFIYSTPTLSENKTTTVVSTDAWSEKNNEEYVSIPFTVTKSTRLTSFSVNTSKIKDSEKIAVILTNIPSHAPTYNYASASSDTGSFTVNCNVALEPGNTYYMVFTNAAKLATKTTGTYGNFVFADANYAGQITFADIDE